MNKPKIIVYHNNIRDKKVYIIVFINKPFNFDLDFDKAKEILKSELKEQILKDGAHFELTPMYHQIMFFRLLDCISLVKNNTFKNQELLVFLEDIASKMLSWLKNITFKNGEIPLLNDSAFSIAPTSDTLFDYVRRLNIKDINLALSQSGYRKKEKNS